MTTLRRMLTLQRSGTTAGARTAPPASQHPATSNQHRGASRRAVTLIELLITMTIMAIIAAAILGTAAAAIEGAREKKTQSLITKLHTLLMERYASYETRRIDVDPRITQAIDKWVSDTVAAASDKQLAFRNASIARGQMLADARLLGLRELMKKEMPDRGDDIILNLNDVLILSRPPALAQTYYRRSQQLPSGTSLSSAECLYLVVMNATGDGEARTLFSKQDIGDVNDNGAPEFIDGWGNPIAWMRWPAGIVSDLQPLNSAGQRPGDVDHDPFDLFRRDSPTVTTPGENLYPTDRNFQKIYKENLRKRIQIAAADPTKSHLNAFRLVPFIYSAGPDGESAMLIPKDSTVAPLDPYLTADDGSQAGAPDPEKPGANKDNITNHLIEF